MLAMAVMRFHQDLEDVLACAVATIFNSESERKLAVDTIP